MTKTVSALFDTYDLAKAAVHQLELMGIARSEVSVVANNAEGHHRGDHDQDVKDGAGAGASAGTAVGGIGGLLAGLGLLAIPGVGPVVAAGWLVATAVGAGAGAAVGAAAGGLIGAMTDAGISERDAHVYAEGVRRGGTLVTARVDEGQATQAQSVLERSKSVDVESRGKAYRDAGWTSFDQTAPAFTAEQVAQERSRNVGAGL